MFALQGGQHATYFYPDPANTANSNDPLGSAGSWDTPFSSPDELGLGSTTFLPKGAGGNRGSPLSHLPSFDQISSGGMPAGLASMGSLSLADQSAFLQASLERQPSLGWGGRPLQQQQQQHHSKHQMNQQNRNRGRGGGDDFSRQGSSPSHPQNYNGQQQQRGGPRGNNNSNQGHNNGAHQHNNGRNRNNNNNNGNSYHRGGGQHRHNNNNGTSNGMMMHNGGGAKGAAAAAAAAAAAGNQGYRRLWQQVTSIHRGGRLGESEGGNHFSEATVEDLLEVVRRLPAEASAVQAVAQGLYSLDSGALAALLKELNKAGHARRAQEIFDWLRSLDPTNDLSSLCTTMTYTTMISQCGTQHALRRALELMAEMRSRGVQCNVHTYSALMNVCIKANELELALDVYRQMIAEGCAPNLVTYNTLIDVYGKTGAWEEAVGVLDLLESQGIEPEVRTYNTVIIACNQSSRAAEALRVYERMLAAGAHPTATTYTALISAYGKAGQLDAALQIFQDMLHRGCERNVITYSSLISACEKAGKWELALQLFQEMHAEGCRPNVVTYNSLIAACAQGAQWKKAQELFDQMQAKGCRPDSVTFGGLIAAYDRAGLWRRALAAFEQMRSFNCRPDTVVYNTIIGALWRTGLLWAQSRAVQIFHGACKQGHFRLTVHTIAAGGAVSSDGSPGTSGSPTSATAAAAAAAALQSHGSGKASELFSSSTSTLDSSLVSLSLSTNGIDSLSPEDLALLGATCHSPSPHGRGGSDCSPMSPPLSPAPSLGLTAAAAAGTGVTVEFGMHAFTVGSAVLSLLRWVSELRDRLPRDPARISAAQTVALILNKGKPSREHTYPAIKAALTSSLVSWASPFVLSDVPQGCRIEAPANEVCEWLATPDAEATLAAFAAQGSGGRAVESPNGSNASGANSAGSGNADCGGGNSAGGAAARDAFFHEDSMVESRCTEAFSAVGRFESAYTPALIDPAVVLGATEGGEEEAAAATAAAAKDAAVALATQRRRWFRATADLASVLGYSDEVVHDATLLLDRAVAAAGSKPLGVTPAAAVVAGLFIAARQAGEQSAHGAIPQEVAAAAGLEAGESESAATVLRTLLGGDTSSISALRVLKLYLERLGADFSSGTPEGLRPAAGAALDLLPEAICDAEMRKLPPSTVAAAVLVAGRRIAGRSPFWPASLATLTGLSDTEEGTPLAIAAERAFSLATEPTGEAFASPAALSPRVSFERS